METRKKLVWRKIDDSYDLQLLNFQDVEHKALLEQLENVKRPNPEYDKKFNKKASRLFMRWLNNTTEPLPEAFYCLLSNWFLTHCSAAKSSRARYALQLWGSLFCAKPKDRLTDWRVSGEKVVPDRFKRWWEEQMKCQEDC